MVPSNPYKKAVLEGLIDTAGLLDACFLGLFTNPITLTGQTLMADLTEPTSVAGYARLAAVWGPVSNGPNDGYKTVAGTVQWNGDTAHPVTIIGWFLASALTAGALKFAEVFEAPIPLPTDDDALTLILEYVLGDGIVGGQVITL